LTTAPEDCDFALPPHSGTRPQSTSRSLHLKDEERLKHYREAFTILEQDVPGIGLYQDFAIYGARRELQWKPTANEAFFVTEMRWQWHIARLGGVADEHVHGE